MLTKVLPFVNANCGLTIKNFQLDEENQKCIFKTIIVIDVVTFGQVMN
jgi:hypothetical protein